MSRARALLGLMALAIAGCGSEPTVPARWRDDCPPRAEVAPLSLDAAREAQRVAAQRHALRFREAETPGRFLREARAWLDPAALASGALCLQDVADVGRFVFEHEYGFADGLGGKGAAEAPRGPFRRVHGGAFGGPETISCTSCHWVGGPNGSGAETDTVFLDGDGAGIGSADERNAPALVAPGVVQALAAEMTEDLKHLRAGVLQDAARAGEPRSIALVSKGIDFGTLRATARGEVDTGGVRGVDADLVVKPFGWKGTLATFTSFSAEALQVHIGIQSDALLASGTREQLGEGEDRRDPDADGVRDELGPGPFAALAVHLALLEMPIVEPLIQDRQLPTAAEPLLPPTTTSFAEEFQRGRQQFHDLGCAGCHTPMLVLQRPTLSIDGLPPIDLAAAMRQPGLHYDPALGGYPVWLFSDLKRHDMGPANAARHQQNGVAVREYLTPRLWGVADSGPYLHDGRAPSFDYAIAGHDGEGAAARAAFEAIPLPDRGPLRVYLMSLRRAPRVIVP